MLASGRNAEQNGQKLACPRFTIKPPTSHSADSDSGSAPTGQGYAFSHFLPGATPCLQQPGGSTYSGHVKALGGRLLSS